MKISFVIVLVMGLMFFGALFFLARAEKEEAFVTRVIDGDTLELNTSEKVRLLGINTPEKGEPFYSEAKQRLENLVLNKKVLMEKDEEDRDKYGRLLRYVYIGDEMVNIILLEEGLATVYIVRPNGAYSTFFRDVEENAMISRKGMWSLVSEHRCAKCIGVDINWNAEGDDCKNPNDEWVEFINLCGFECELKGWSIKDAGTASFVFPRFTLGPKSTVALFSGAGTNSARELYWNKKGTCPAVWNNDGDTLFLRDGEGMFVLKETYEGFE